MHVIIRPHGAPLRKCVFLQYAYTFLVFHAAAAQPVGEEILWNPSGSNLTVSLAGRNLNGNLYIFVFFIKEGQTGLLLINLVRIRIYTHSRS